VRAALYRTITSKISDDDGNIPLWTLDRNLEEVLAHHIVQTDQGPQLSLDPETVQNILRSINEQIEKAAELGMNAVILCSPVVRSHFKRLTERFIPSLVVISHNELSPDANVQSIGQVRLSHAS